MAWHAQTLSRVPQRDGGRACCLRRGLLFGAAFANSCRAWPLPIEVLQCLSFSLPCSAGVSCVVRHPGPFASQDSLSSKKIKQAYRPWPLLLLATCARRARPARRAYLPQPLCRGVAHAVRRGLAKAVLRRWRRVADPADVLAGRAGRPPSPPDPGLPLLPPLPIAAIPLPDGMAVPLAAFGAGRFLGCSVRLVPCVCRLLCASSMSSASIRHRGVRLWVVGKYSDAPERPRYNTRRELRAGVGDG